MQSCSGVDNCAGRACREKDKPKPSWFSARKLDAGSPVSSHHGKGFLDGLFGKPHLYQTGRRKKALI